MSGIIDLDLDSNKWFHDVITFIRWCLIVSLCVAYFFEWRHYKDLLTAAVIFVLLFPLGGAYAYIISYVVNTFNRLASGSLSAASYDHDAYNSLAERLDDLEATIEMLEAQIDDRDSWLDD